ncbi:MAG TPA: hypothetical protein VN756_09935 [Solirubrobacterales bacterium]|nr:hypothetical protein [Solirubrobacterales bacterium]
MSTIVWVLSHHWDEGGSEIRGIYFSEEEAERDLPVEVVEQQMLRSDDGPACRTFRHDQFCCSVEQYPVRDRAIGAVALPERPVSGDPLIPEAVLHAIYETMTSKFPEHLKERIKSASTNPSRD